MKKKCPECGYWMTNFNIYNGGIGSILVVYFCDNCQKRFEEKI
ncbi:DNA-directed RNA polymerase subunit RPC12/RpoP [Elusimicrobium simillimum]